jgi:hypothetical protein
MEQALIYSKKQDEATPGGTLQGITLNHHIERGPSPGAGPSAISQGINHAAATA